MTELRQLQLIILDLALELKRICDKYELRYFLVGGSLLGAIRHNGFIPWDDDMDIGMPRSDYEKFISIAKDELNEDYFLQICETDPNYGHGYAKLRVNNTDFVEDYTTVSKQNNGVFLDLFPFDSVTDNNIVLKFQYIRAKSAKWALLSKSNYNFTQKKRRRFAKMMSIAFVFYNREKTYRLLNKICMSTSKAGANRLINFFGAYRLRDYVEINDIKELETINFEGYEFYIPSNSDQILRRLYGDYMVLPPEDQRGIRHNIVKIDFGEYKIKNKNMSNA